MTRLIEAVESENVEEVKQLIEEGENVNEKMRDGTTALIAAVKKII